MYADICVSVSIYSDSVSMCLYVCLHVCLCQRHCVCVSICVCPCTQIRKQMYTPRVPRGIKGELQHAPRGMIFSPVNTSEERATGTKNHILGLERNRYSLSVFIFILLSPSRFCFSFYIYLKTREKNREAL